ncbi:YraN family protein [Dokdonella sp. MW10]|uniref:YraN family protein n=1 Tax=Dokdonella sp. MW10 TaxID=2992926 RepID=UPI003F8082E8
MRAAGATFEDLALAHAQRHGLALVARNVNYRHGELDLVMRDGTTVVFIEVRYRRSGGFGGALDSVTASKRARLVAAAGLFLQSRPDLARHACRFDVLAITGSAQAPEIDWHRNAFDA